MHYLALIKLVSTKSFNFNATPTNYTDYSCHTKAVVRAVGSNFQWSGQTAAELCV